MRVDPRIIHVAERYDEIEFRPARRFHWSPSDLAVEFDVRRIHTEAGMFQFLHELGHALLGHEPVERPIDKWRHDRDAWDVARVLAATSRIPPDLDYLKATLGKYERRLGLRRRPK